MGKDKRAFDVLAPHLQSTNASLRCMALRLVSEAVQKGNRYLQDAVIAHISDPDESVRSLVPDALKNVCACGDPHVIVALRDYLSHGKAEVREIGVRAFLAVADPHDQETLRISAVL